jgi:CDGSH-type Zn-finger protein
MTEGTKITAKDNGPYLVTGPVTITDAEGNQFQTNRETVALCRCGGSQNKPFCDGTHSKVGFQAANRAVREAEGQDSGDGPPSGEQPGPTPPP